MTVVLSAPNGAKVEARDDAVPRLLEAGFAFSAPEPQKKPKAAPRKRTARTPKE